MRSVIWIAADLSREAVARPGLLALATGMIAVVPFQLGLSVGGLSRMAVPGEWVRDFMTASALCPAMSAVFLFSGIVFPRLVSHEMEPLLAAPVTDRQMALGIVLPFLAQAVVGSIPASVFTLVGFALAAGGMPRGMAARGLDLVLAMQVSNLWIGCALIRSVCRLTGAAGTAWNLLLACLGLAIIDAAIGLWSGPELSPRMLLRAVVLLAAVPASWWLSRHVDREALIGSR